AYFEELIFWPHPLPHSGKRFFCSSRDYCLNPHNGMSPRLGRKSGAGTYHLKVITTDNHFYIHYQWLSGFHPPLLVFNRQVHTSHCSLFTPDSYRDRFSLYCPPCATAKAMAARGR